MTNFWTRRSKKKKGNVMSVKFLKNMLKKHHSP
jgi:hypothetical protein